MDRLYVHTLYYKYSLKATFCKNGAKTSVLDRLFISCKNITWQQHASHTVKKCGLPINMFLGYILFLLPCLPLFWRAFLLNLLQGFLDYVNTEFDFKQTYLPTDTKLVPILLIMYWAEAVVEYWPVINNQSCFGLVLSLGLLFFFLSAVGIALRHQ